MDRFQRGTRLRLQWGVIAEETERIRAAANLAVRRSTGSRRDRDALLQIWLVARWRKPGVLRSVPRFASFGIDKCLGDTRLASLDALIPIARSRGRNWTATGDDEDVPRMAWQCFSGKLNPKEISQDAVDAVDAKNRSRKLNWQLVQAMRFFDRFGTFTASKTFTVLSPEIQLSRVWLFLLFVVIIININF